jgi:hypothetical protein
VAGDLHTPQNDDHLDPPDIVKFREMLEQRLQRQETPFASFPDEHRPLIAKLAHERFAEFRVISKTSRLLKAHN